MDESKSTSSAITIGRASVPGESRIAAEIAAETRAQLKNQRSLAELAATAIEFDKALFDSIDCHWVPEHALDLAGDEAADLAESLGQLMVTTGGVIAEITRAQRARAAA
jgi:hypothetical protein